MSPFVVRSGVARATACGALLVCALASRALAGGNCAAPPTGFTPLTDLGTGTYQGVEGGLYPGGANHRPDAHEAAGLAIAQALAPLDTLGQPDATHGRVVLISIGMSNCTMEFSAFVPKARSFAGRNPRLLPIDCALGGQSVDRIVDPNASYWDTVATRLRAHGSSPLQPQAVWIKEAIANPRGDFAASTDTLQRGLATVVRLIHLKLPNVKLVYITSRIYAGYATTTLNPEPYAYQSGFAVRGVIAEQLAGVDSLNFDSTRGPVEAPWLAWGPYLWADGTNPRADGFTWPCSMFQADGTHPAAAGQSLVADSLLAFFSHDDTAAPWFDAAAASASPAPAHGLALAVAPNPARRDVAFTLQLPDGARWRLELLDGAGRRVRVFGSGAAAGGRVALRWDGRDARGQLVPPGVYVARLSAGTRSVTRLVTRF